MKLQQNETAVLTAAVKAEDRGEDADRAARDVVDQNEYKRCVQRLHDAGYVQAAFLAGDGGRLMGAHIQKVLPPGIDLVRSS